MKIYASRRDDLIAERDAYDAETAKYQNRIDEGEKRWKQDTRAIENSVKEEVEHAIGETSLELEVYASAGWDIGYEVRVRANEHRKFEDGVALAWNYEAKIDRQGNLVKDSGSWSGLKVVTPEQIADLEESVRVMKVLNGLDWEHILMRANPQYSAYVSKEDSEALRNRKNNRRDYDKEIFEEDLKEAIQSGAWIKMEGRPETEYYRGSRRGEYWCKISSMTDKQVKCIITQNLEHYQNNPNYYYEERMSKAKLYPQIVKPLETITI